MTAAAGGTDGAALVRSVCHACHGGCGVLLDIRDGVLKAVRPDPASTFSEGYICGKATAMPSLMGHPSRVLHPLKRAGERGSQQWTRVSWDDALAEIASRLSEIREQSGAESIALGQGTARHHYCHVRRFANTLGTPNWYEPGLANCLVPRLAASFYTYGEFTVPDYYSKAFPSTILVWGANPVISNPDGKLGFRVRRALQNGSHGIAIDPRRAETARLCATWLPIRPGTDAALALAMLHVMTRERLYDQDFVDRHTVGFPQLFEHLAKYTPSWASSITGLQIAQIVQTARQYATSGPSVIDWGVAIDQNVNSLQTARAVCILRALSGNLDIPRGEAFGKTLLAPFPLETRSLKLASIRKRLGGDQFQLLGGPAAPLPSAHIPALFDAIDTGKPYRVRALLLFGNNPLLTIAQPQRVERALHKLELLVAMDMFLTPSAQLADFVLPAAFWPEFNHVTELPAFAPKAVVIQQKAVATGEARADEDVLSELARRLGLRNAEMSPQDIIDQRLAPLGITFGELTSTPTLDTDYTFGARRSNGFKTPSGKAELFSRPLERLGLDPLPTYIEPPESPLSQPGLAEHFPLVLITGARRSRYFHSEGRQRPRSGRAAMATAEISTKTAHSLCITHGDVVRVRSPRGAILATASVTSRIADAVVSVDHGWWFPDSIDAENRWVTNANVLTSSQPPYDRALGTYQLRGLLCRIEKVDDQACKAP